MLNEKCSLEVGYRMCELVSSAIRQVPLLYDVDGETELFKLSCDHKLTALISTVIDKNSKDYPAWNNAFNLSVVRKTLMDYERQNLISFLRENNIWFLLLKGLVLQNLYPDPHYREMCDNDIMYAPDAYPQVREYMLSNGYKIDHASKDVHVDEYQKEPYCYFEMHKGLFNVTRGKLAEYFRNIADRLIVVDECERKLSDEDFYVYMVAHSYKHFIDGGTGLRSFLDCYLYNDKVSYDKDYVKSQLKLIGIDEFEKKFSTLSYKLFCGESISLTTDEEEMLLYVVSSGAYGTKENYIANKLKTESRFSYVFNRAFPPLEWYKGHVPFCYKHKWSIPFYCIYRLFDRCIKHNKRIKREIEIVSKTKENPLD